MRDLVRNRKVRNVALFLMDAVILMTLCRIHGFTAYKTARSLQDLFYWPDGFCADMVILGAFLLMAVVTSVQAVRMVNTLRNK